MAEESKLNHLILGVEGNPTFILLHGWGLSFRSLLPLGTLLSDSFHVHLIDLPGFGDSPLPPGASNKETSWDTYQYAERIIQYMNENDIHSAKILGHSFGGRVCLQLASKFANRIEEVILMDSAGLKPIRSFKSKIRIKRIRLIGWAIRFSKPLMSQKRHEKYYAWFGNKYGSTDYKNAGNLKHVFIKTVNEDQTESVKSIKKKCLILWGKDDTETPVYMANLLHSYIEKSKLIILGHKGHEPYSGLGSHLCAYHILNFLN